MPESKEILGEFIECYKTNRVLWDTTNKDYLNKNKKTTGYAELLNILKKMKVNASIEDVKRKINTLRSSFRKELKKIKKSECSGTGTDSIYVPSIWWYDSLKFIEHLEKPVDSISTMDDDLEEQSSNFENDTLLSPPAKKPKSSTQDELLSLACGYLKNGTEDNDPFYFMARTWANKLKNLSRLQQLRVEKKINDVFYEAEMEDISRGPTRSAESASISITEDNSLLEDISQGSSRTIFNEYGSNSYTSCPATLPHQQILTMSLIPPDQSNANLTSISRPVNILSNLKVSGTSNIRNYLNNFNEYEFS